VGPFDGPASVDTVDSDSLNLAFGEGCSFTLLEPPASDVIQRDGLGFVYQAIGRRDQISAISDQPSAISHQRSAISDQPSAISHQPSAISDQPSAISHQPSATRQAGIQLTADS